MLVGLIQVLVMFTSEQLLLNRRIIIPAVNYRQTYYVTELNCTSRNVSLDITEFYRSLSDDFMKLSLANSIIIHIVAIVLDKIHGLQLY